MTTEQKPFIKRKTVRIILPLIFLLALVVGAVLFFNYRQQQIAKNTLNDLDLVTFKRETLVSSISGTGTVKPKQDALLVWETNGTVADVNVKVGEIVQKNELLMNLDEKDLPMEILQARMDKLNIEQALQDLEENTVIQRAQLSSNIATAQQAMNSMENELLLLQERVCKTKQLKSLRADYKDLFETYQESPSEENWAKVKQAKIAVDFCEPDAIKLLINEKQSQIDLQKENITAWQAELEIIKDGPDPKEQEKLELQLDIVKKRLEAVALRAPITGTVSELYSAEGDLVTTGAQALQISDLSQLYVVTPISEVDIPTIEIGQKAELIFDAFFNDTFTGIVSEVSKVGISQQGIINYMVKIKLDNGLDRLKPGMTAGVTILIEEKPNVLVVPNDAIAVSEGRDVVYVLRDGLPEAVEVKLGAYSNDSVEVLEANIEEGESIILNPPTSILDAMSGGFFPGRNFR